MSADKLDQQFILIKLSNVFLFQANGCYWSVVMLNKYILFYLLCVLFLANVLILTKHL